MSSTNHTNTYQDDHLSVRCKGSDQHAELKSEKHHPDRLLHDTKSNSKKKNCRNKKK
ncbi:uncharacterized protein J3R85_002419 [Psidium guajava]|nr:uncharacterized protein J3R85_002419 [Psidium guajava]